MLGQAESGQTETIGGEGVGWAAADARRRSKSYPPWSSSYSGRAAKAMQLVSSSSHLIIEMLG